ncbi:hypothetical protein J3A83DRAFT_4240397 [Scleroderma citrinum]
MLDRDQAPTDLLTELRQLKATQNNKEVQGRLETIESILERLLEGQGHSQEDLVSDTRQSAKGQGEGTRASTDLGNLRRRWHSFLHRPKRAPPAHAPAPGLKSSGSHSLHETDIPSGVSRPAQPSFQELAHDPKSSELSPLSDTLVEVLREHQEATVAQLREMTGYMRGLNDSLSRDAVDRQQELRGVTARIDQLRSEMGPHKGDASTIPSIHHPATEGQAASDSPPDTDPFSTAPPSMHRPIEPYEPTVVTYTPSVGTFFPVAVPHSDQVSTSAISLAASGQPSSPAASQRLSHSPATRSVPVPVPSSEQRNPVVHAPRSPTPPPAHRQYISNIGPSSPIFPPVPPSTGISLTTSTTSPRRSFLSPPDSPIPLQFLGGRFAQHTITTRTPNYEHPGPEHFPINKTELEPGQVVRDAYDTQTRHQDEFGQAGQLNFQANETRRGSEPGQQGDEPQDIPPLLSSHLRDRTQALDATIIPTQATMGDTVLHPVPSALGAVDMLIELIGKEREPPTARANHESAGIPTGRTHIDKAREVKIRGLEEELNRVRGERDNEQQLYMDGSGSSRVTVTERHEALRNQLSDIANMVQQLHSEYEGRRQEKQRRENERDSQIQELLGIATRIVEEQAAAKVREEEENYTLRSDTQRQYDELIGTIRATANEQVPYNVQGYLDEFSKVLAGEVRMLLGEVGKLREERRSIQHELGFLMMMKSKYGPGGEFDPDWHPPMPPPPPDAPSAQVRQRSVPQRRDDDSNPDWQSDVPPHPRLNGILSGSPLPSPSPPPPPESASEPRYTESWATWHPNPALSPTPPSIEPSLLPDRQSPGLFGPRSPRGSFS